ncbi:MAG: putative toxin-antitoxin system toxin component, PIN family [Deltaproteobacteria bacterium]|nr:putative toxin-antitoxin system toxin component, PIN family [Deltaproteobacteria bacterium]
MDTNILISGMLNPPCPPGRIVDLLRSGALRIVVDDRILSEYTDVLRREYFLEYFTFSERKDVIGYLKGVKTISTFMNDIKSLNKKKALKSHAKSHFSNDIS